ncbi:DUF4169 family protein [Novosphingobium sp. KN65.2]|uniref:DUF4169 family protein n=1 Tax=Novosphingobium sp. KN65.2 TaxID=1478134 RepID=UPI0005DF0BD3|nr:DUF4169 family protein [Novosphingobium sp. KN65.2]CDO36275.1 conserved hypothetical protein [Novosphingobium sp. KN65.2]
MAEIINLRLARKARDRAADKAQAHSNRALHGRTKAERKATEAEAARFDRTLDGAKRERDSDGNGDVD